MGGGEGGQGIPLTEKSAILTGSLKGFLKTYIQQRFGHFDLSIVSVQISVDVSGTDNSVLSLFSS